MRYLPNFFQHLIWLPIRLVMRLRYRVSIRGLENIKNTKGSVVFAANHSSQIDPLFIVASLPYFSKKIPLAFVVSEKETYSQTWHGWRKYLYGGLLFRMIGGYEAYSGRENYDNALPHHIKALKMGNSVCIFPVGRRHEDSETALAKGGVSYLAKKTKTPIIPVRITGKKTKKLVISFGEPIYSQSIFTDKELKKTDTYGQQFDTAAIKIMKKINTLK